MTFNVFKVISGAFPIKYRIDDSNNKIVHTLNIKKAQSVTTFTMKNFPLKKCTMFRTGESTSQGLAQKHSNIDMDYDFKSVH